MSRPFNDKDAESIRRRKAEEAMAEMQNLAFEIGKSWKSPKSAIELLDQDRC